MHLGVVDILLCFTFFVFSLPNFATKPGTWLLTSSNWACTTHGVLLTLLNPMAVWTMCGLNCDRFYAIASPLHYGAIVNARRVSIGLALGWLVTVMLTVPPLTTFVAPFHYNPVLAACLPNFTLPESIWYTAIYTTITFLLPAAIISGCNVKVNYFCAIIWT